MKKNPIKNILNFNKQCILCKYKYDDEACKDAIYHNDKWDCPTLSNIFYGKIVELPVIKQIYDCVYEKQMEKEMKRYDDYYINEYETKDMLFIWGIKSYDDLSGNRLPNMHTMNDLELIYHKDTNNYSISIETIYLFRDNGQYGYMQSLLDEFTKWMNENNYATDREFALFEVFTDGISINNRFDSIEEAYAAFKMMVNGYCSLNKTN